MHTPVATGHHRRLLGQGQFSDSVDAQVVVLFSSAHDAGGFFTASAQSWPAAPTGATPSPGRANTMWCGSRSMVASPELFERPSADQ